jgi:hypothetical protein
MRSIPTFSTAQPSIVAAKTPRSCRIVNGPQTWPSVRPKRGMRLAERKAPKANTSPCAKLMSSMIP